MSIRDSGWKKSEGKKEIKEEIFNIKGIEEEEPKGQEKGWREKEK